MALSRGDRFKLKSQLVEELSDNSWSLQRINLLLNEFGLRRLQNWDASDLERAIGDVSDSALTEMYALALGVEVREVEDVVESPASTQWTPGYVRLFLSHSAVHKEFAGKVANELATGGIHGFVAHDAMEYTKPWQTQIERALRSMQAFAALVHPEFNDSAWCQQETGWAFGRRVPRYAVRMGSNPRAFLGSDQWPSGAGRSPKEVAHMISAWVASLPELGEILLDGLFSALAEAGSYVEAAASAERLVALGELSNEQFRRLDGIWWSNDQLHGGALAHKVMKPFYLANGQDWPPRRDQAEDPF